MSESNEWSSFFDYLSKIAACSVVLVGVSFCAGYFLVYGYLGSFRAEWFMGFYSFSELVVRGMWYASLLFLIMIFVLLFARVPNLKIHNLTLLTRIVSWPFIAVTVVFFIGLAFGYNLIPQFLGRLWSAGWMAVIAASIILYSLHPQASHKIAHKFMLISSVCVLIASIICLSPMLAGAAAAQAVRDSNYRNLSSVAKVEKGDRYKLLATGGGKFLLSDKGWVLTVVDPLGGWSINN